MTTPFNTACPNNAMKPMAADTLKGMLVNSNAKMPPMSAKGTFNKINNALTIDLKASNNNTKIKKTLTGTMNANRFIARC